jgi:CRISPR-associated endonuclease/helicase Cas3
MVDRSDFAGFFAACNDGREPFSWQVRLLEEVIETGRWPDLIDAPTGAGKSSVLEIHVFANAVAAAHPFAAGSASRIPRRLAITVDRRALVDGHAERAARLASELARASGPGTIMGAVADSLRGMRAAGEADGVAPLVVSKLRGGAPPDRSWLDHPTACQVIAGTPDMIGSRLLFRGYGSTRFAWPREAGLLAWDTVMVVDEAHLNRQLIATARRVSNLVAQDRRGIPVSPLEVCAMTATQVDGIGHAVGVRAEDLEKQGPDAVLQARLVRPKPVTLTPSSAWPGSGGRPTALAADMARLAREALEDNGPTVGCVVNSVALALELSEQLTVTGTMSEEALSVLTLVGPMRPYELAQIRDEHPSLFTLEGDPTVDVLVATQTVEVGVDLNLSCLVTELASGAALAQRAGRVNRSGAAEAGPVNVVVAAGAIEAGSRSGPYREEELTEGLRWLQDLEPTVGLAPWAIHPRGGGAAPPPSQPTRPALHRPERWDVDEWARTGDRQLVEPWLDLWLSDDLAPDLTAGIVMRSGLPRDLASARQQLAVTPPGDHEVYPVRVTVAARALKAVAPHLKRAFVVGPSEVAALSGREEVEEHRLRPGEVIVLDSVREVTRRGVVTADSPAGEPPDDVGELWPPTVPRAALRWVRLGARTPAATRDGETLPGLDGLMLDVRQAVLDDHEIGAGGDDLSMTVGSLVREWLAGLSGPDRKDERRVLLAQIIDSANLQVITPEGLAASADPAEADDDFWLVLAGAAALADEEVRQSWQETGAVDLDEHQEQVRSQALALSSKLELGSDLTEALGRAGLCHDEGKRDPRFQRGLRWRPSDHPDRVLAKSGMRSQRAIVQARAASGLPSGWRHEQLSAAIAWADAGDQHHDVRDLVARLVGTSHGRGRHEYPHVGAELGGGAAGATGREELFDSGEWENLLDRTTRRWGPWGVAYLESILRAADVNVSRRGS